jgi:hypothetical protein
MTDAVYYAQREQAERALAHKYAELTKRESVLEPFWNVRAA